MTNLIVKMLVGNKYWTFGIAFAIAIGSIYFVWNTPFQKVFLNCTGITIGMISSPIAGWNFGRIMARD